MAITQFDRLRFGNLTDEEILAAKVREQPGVDYMQGQMGFNSLTPGTGEEWQNYAPPEGSPAGGRWMRPLLNPNALEGSGGGTYTYDPQMLSQSLPTLNTSPTGFESIYPGSGGGDYTAPSTPEAGPGWGGGPNVGAGYGPEGAGFSSPGQASFGAAPAGADFGGYGAGYGGGYSDGYSDASADTGASTDTGADTGGTGAGI